MEPRPCIDNRFRTRPSGRWMDSSASFFSCENGKVPHSRHLIERDPTFLSFSVSRCCFAPWPPKTPLHFASWGINVLVHATATEQWHHLIAKAPLNPSDARRAACHVSADNLWTAATWFLSGPLARSHLPMDGHPPPASRALTKLRYHVVTLTPGLPSCERY